MKRKEFVSAIMEIPECMECPIETFCHCAEMCPSCVETASKFWRYYREDIKKCQSLEDLVVRFMSRKR